QYRVDGGPLAKKPDGTEVIGNAAGVARVKSLFDVWQNVPTSAIAFNNAGCILGTAPNCGDVQNVADFNAADAACNAGTNSPIIFDADGSIFAGLGFSSGVIGFAGPCSANPATGHFVSGEAALNGRWQDEISANGELTAEQFDEAFAHEFGHFAGLDHSQINQEILFQPGDGCSLDDLAGLPLMFPFLHCQARVTAGLSTLAPDDIAWISRLYPVTAPAPGGKTVTSSVYATISGTVFFTDGVTQAQGVNVIARLVGNPRRVAVSVVSGYLFTGNLGQTVTCTDPANPTPSTCTNRGGSPFGSRDPRMIGTYDLPVPVPAETSTYTIQVESINPNFTTGSSVGPLDPPIRNPGQDAQLPNTITIAAGQSITGTDIVLQGTPARFDSFESAWLLWRAPLELWLRDEKRLVEQIAG
ncbi:MAG: hypothetical protein HY237_11210, partial [Acidobacteria bacterium]|nr:hypothetical protein [Acidobacteriota bacterium]